MNERDKNLSASHENGQVENNDLNKMFNSQLSTFNLDDDKVVFVPAEEIRAIENIYNKMGQAQQEFRKVAEELRKWEC